jgi:hypothetical protein
MTFYAAADPGTSSNAFAFVVVESVDRRRIPTFDEARRLLGWRVRHIQTWQGRQGAPLDVRNVVGPAVCRLALSWGCENVMTDIHEWAGMQLAGQACGVRMLLDNAELVDSCLDARIVVHEKRLSFDQRIGPDLIRRVTRQLGAITSKVTEKGVRIVWPGEGHGHGDEARALVRALYHAKAGRAVVAMPGPAVKIESLRVAAYASEASVYAASIDPWYNPRRDG